MVKFKDKYYTHFDVKKKAIKYIDKIKDPSWVTRHAFYPFIHYKIVFKKYVFNPETQMKEKKDKERDIYYSAHIDRFIYQYYAELINMHYNQIAKKLGINNVSTAYRNNKKGKCNIHFAKEALEFICKCKEVWILVGDFSSFFDNLDADYLKEKLQQVLQVDRLPEDQYAVFKSITKYTYVERDDIELIKGKKLNEMRRENKYFETEQFQVFKKTYLKKHDKTYGIPQGSSISAVYANVYMLDFDKIINDYVTSKKGMYRRYCDDIIIIIPINKHDIENKMNEEYVKYLESVRSSIPRLSLNLDKTEQYYYNQNEEKRLVDLKGKKDILNYLGFSFDGRYVRLREKSLFKYYSRAYKKVKAVKKSKGKREEFAVKKSLYRLYTHLGDKKYNGEYGNFITYARRAEEVFSDSTYLNSKIHGQVKRHWSKIQKRLKSD